MFDSLLFLNKKHARLMTFFGALIVFLTFIVNDVLSENLKNSLSSLHAVSAEYETSKQSDALQASLLTINESLETLENNERLAKAKDTRKVLANVLAVYVKNEEDAYRFTSHALTLAEHTPGAGQSVQALKDNQRQLDAAGQLNLKRIKVAMLYGTAAGKIFSEQDAVDALTLVDESLRMQTIKTTSEDALDDAASVAKQKVEQYEHWSGWARRAGYVLYVLGWALGLFGGLAGKADGGEGRTAA